MSDRHTPARAPEFVSREGRLHMLTGEGAARPVRLAWARPITGVGKEIAVFGEDRKEICLVHDLAALDEASRELVLRAIGSRYILPRILRIHSLRALFGYRYWHVLTDRGSRRFVLKDPGANLLVSGEGRWVLKDSHGNRYEIPDARALDPASRALLEKAR